MKIGNRVKIIGGPHIGMNGVIQRPYNKANGGTWAWNILVENVDPPQNIPYFEDELQVIDCPCGIKYCLASHR